MKLGMKAPKVKTPKVSLAKPKAAKSMGKPKGY